MTNGSGILFDRSTVGAPLRAPDAWEAIDEITGLSTNTLAQNSLEWIEVLETCSDSVPE